MSRARVLLLDPRAMSQFELPTETATYDALPASRRAALAGLDRDTALIRAADVAKGLSYVIAAGLAAGLALSAIDAPTRSGLVFGLLAKPLTQGLLLVMALGLSLYALSKLFRAARDAADDPEGVIRRIGLALGGSVHLLTAIVTFAACYGAGRPEITPLSAQLMAPRFGAWAIMSLGIGLALFGALQIYHAVSGGYEGSIDRELRVSSRALFRFGQIGVIARGLALPVVGTFLVITAAESSPTDAMSIAAKLERLLSGGAGPIMLLVVAAACAVYGGAVLALARYRRVSKI